MQCIFCYFCILTSYFCFPALTIYDFLYFLHYYYIVLLLSKKCAKINKKSPCFSKYFWEI